MNAIPSATATVDADAPLTNFTNCHGGIIKRLNALDELPALLAPAARAREIAEQSLEFFREAIFEHHLEEERELFPAVIASATPGEELLQVKAMTTRLTQEHRMVEALWKKLESGLKRVAKGQSTDLDVSEVQRRQMTTPTDANVHALAVDGDFDDCQAALKDMFNDFDFRDEVRLAGVNSINFARVLAQVVYYFTSAVSLGAPERKVSFTVPTGNFGDIFAGFIAKQMGLPIDQLVVATNQNDILHRCLSGQGYHKGETIPSISPSMDIQVSSNFERALFYAYGKDGAAVAQLMDELKTGGFEVSQGAMQALQEHYVSGRCSEEETSATIKSERAASGELLCPHSAIGVKVANEQRDAAVPMVTLATAHPAKFPAAVEEASGIHPPLPPRMADLYDRSERVTRIANDLTTLETHIRKHIAH